MEKTTGEADIQENKLKELSPDLLNTLLKDHTTSKEGKQCNIFWATSDYEPLGRGYEYGSQILPELITGENGHVVMPRVLKHRDTQSTRSREMAEVFTPSWICNAQNNLIDEAWFGRKDVFNHEVTSKDGTHSWEINPDKIAFPEGRTWKDYVRENRLEITCGEAPYLVSRYDTTTGWRQPRMLTEASMPMNGRVTVFFLPVKPFSYPSSNITGTSSVKIRKLNPSTI